MKRKSGSLDTLIVDGVKQQAIRCNRCTNIKTFEFFPKNKKCSFGVEKTCKKCKNENCKKWAIKNNYANIKKYLKEHPEKHKERCSSWRKNNPQKRRFYSSKRRKAVQQATPIWADLIAIQAFYDNCPRGYHVDHIIPLQGKTVGGLHVLENLQYLPEKENLSKGNKWTQR